ncbi:MAG TPA: discoidin domain-containing protein [Acidimicrobiia bacterium]
MITHLRFWSETAGASGELGVYRLDGTTIAEVLGKAAYIDTPNAAWVEVELDYPVQIKARDDFLICVTRTDGNIATSAEVSYTTGTYLPTNATFTTGWRRTDLDLQAGDVISSTNADPWLIDYKGYEGVLNTFDQVVTDLITTVGFYHSTVSGDMFLETAGTTPIDANGQTCARINDLNDSYNATTATAGHEPTYNFTNRSLDFDGTNDVLETTLSPGLGETGSFAVRFRADTGIAGEQVLMGSTSGTNRCWISLIDGVVAVGIGDADSATNKDPNLTDLRSATDFHTVGVNWDGGSFDVFLDGNYLFSGARAGVSANGQAIYLGARNNGATADLHFNGEISHWFYTDENLTLWQQHILYCAIEKKVAATPVTMQVADTAFTAIDEPLTLTLPGNGSYLLGITGQDTGISRPADPGVTSWDEIFADQANSFDAVLIQEFEVTDGATSITVDPNWQYRHAQIVYRVQGWDPKVNQWSVSWMANTTEVPVSRVLVPGSAVFMAGNNNDFSDAGARTPSADFTTGAALAENVETSFTCYAWKEEVIKAGSFSAAVDSVTTATRDVAAVMWIPPQPVTTGDNATQAHTYWRVRCIEGAAPGFFSITELEMTNLPGTATITSGETVIFGAERVGFPATEAFDGISGAADDNCWSVDRDGTSSDTWIGIQFASPTSIKEIAITSRDDAFFAHTPTEFTVEYSDDGVQWYVARHVTGEAVWSQNETRRWAV